MFQPRVRSFAAAAFAAAVVAAFAGAPAQAQGTYDSATAAADATATVVTPITISRTADLRFGDVVASNGGDGWVEMNPLGVRTSSGSAELGNGAGAGAASFSLGGDASATYAIILPSGNVNISGPGGSVTYVSYFTSSPSGTGTLAADGSGTLTVGGSLHLDSSQLQGTYSGSFNVTVAYN